MDDAIIPGAVVCDISSRLGRQYRIFTWRPPAASAKLPVLYFLDGNATFPIAASAIALQSRHPERTGVRPAIIVGIGYPTAAPLDAERRTYDYTPRIPRDRLPLRPDNQFWPDTGGADEFLDFLEYEVHPRIERDFAADRTQAALFGHSFGGLFTLHALFSRPLLFRTYIAASPSIWFAEKHLDGQRKMFNAVRTIPTRRLLVTVGSLEQSDAQTADAVPDGHASWLRKNKMVENARSFATELSSTASATLDVTFTAFVDEDHATVVPAVISRSLRFAFAE